MPEPRGVVGSRSNALTNPDIRDKAQVAVRYPESTVLSLQQHLQHCHHIASHLAPMVAAPSPRLLKLAVSRVGRFGYSKNRRPNLTGRCGSLLLDDLARLRENNWRWF
jgi:hypothetical protein